MPRPDTLPAQAYLLAYDRERDRLTRRTWLGYVLRAAALADLWANGHLVDDGGHARVSGHGLAPTDPVLHDVWTETAERSLRWAALIKRNRRRTEDSVATQLDNAGLIRILRGPTLWRKNQIELRDPLATNRLGVHVDALLRGSQPWSRLPRADAALVGLLAVADMRTAIPRTSRREYGDRIAAAIAAGGPAVPALKRAISQARSSMS